MKKNILLRAATAGFLMLAPATAQAACWTLESCAAEHPQAREMLLGAEERQDTSGGRAPMREALNYHIPGIDGTQYQIVGEQAISPSLSRVYYRTGREEGKHTRISPTRSKDCRVTPEPYYVTPQYMNFHLEELAACVTGQPVRATPHREHRGGYGYGAPADPSEQRTYTYGDPVPNDGYSTQGYANQRAKEYQRNQRGYSPNW